MKHTLIAALFFLPQLLWADANSGIFGKWVAQNTIWSRGVEFQLSFNFSPQETALTVACSFNDGAYLQAATSAFAYYSPNQIHIRESRENISQDGYHFCRATLMPSTWEVYMTDEGRMTLFLPIPYQSKFFLVKADSY